MDPIPILEQNSAFYTLMSKRTHQQQREWAKYLMRFYSTYFCSKFFY